MYPVDPSLAGDELTKDMLDAWANNKTGGKLEQYWEEKNSISLEGHDTGILS